MMVKRSTIFKYRSNTSKIETENITSRNFGALLIPMTPYFSLHFLLITVFKIRNNRSERLASSP